MTQPVPWRQGKPSDLPGPQLAGTLEIFSAFEVLPFLAGSGRSGSLTLYRYDGPSASCSFARGWIVAAECGHLTGREAVLALMWWHSGRFEFRQFAGTTGPVEVEVNEILMEGVRLADELEVRNGRIPGRKAPLTYTEQARHSLGDPLDCGIEIVRDALGRELGWTPATLAEQLPLAPMKVHLSLALLVAEGSIPYLTTTPAIGRAGADLSLPWWHRLALRFGGGLRVLVAVEPGLGVDEVQEAVAAIAVDLGAMSPIISVVSSGPSFARLHADSGGFLSITLLPVVESHRRLFLSFAKTCHAILLGTPRLSRPEAPAWLGDVAAEIPVHRIDEVGPLRRSLREGLVRLGEEHAVLPSSTD